jgi:single-strand DNA-binding protein
MTTSTKIQSINSVAIIGRLTKDPELKITLEGKKRLEFCLVTNEFKYSSKEQIVKNTQFHKLVLWGEKAEFASQIMKKGQKISIMGSLYYSDFINKSGLKVTKTEIKVREYEILKNSKKIIKNEDDSIAA